MLNNNKNANISGYNSSVVERYDADMGYTRRDISIERSRIFRTLKKCGMLERSKLIVLDIGVGTGISREIISGILPNAHFIASDISIEMLNKYKEIYSGSICVVCDAEYLPFKENIFGMVLCSSFVHHLPQDNILVTGVWRVLKYSGIFLGIREPRMHGCDFWFRLHYIAKRYGDRAGVMNLLTKIFGGAGGWKKIWTYEMSREEFLALDTMEIRGAILHKTPTKKHGGVNMRKFKKEAEKVFKFVRVNQIGFSASLLEFLSILFQVIISKNVGLIADTIDKHLARFAPFLPFESFSFLCKK
jgi:ubiquinone/menaquinone biosynthesis C-methylase UbiE